MKKFHLFLVCAAVTLTAIPAFGQEEPVFAEGSASIKKSSGFFKIQKFTTVNGMWIPKNDDEESEAMSKAMADAVENAKKAFERACKRSDGEASNVRAVPMRDPSDKSQRKVCFTEWEDSKRTEGTVVCTARAKGTCTIKEEALKAEANKDPRVSGSVAPPARLVEVDGQRFLVDEQGAHPITGATAAQ